MKLEEKIETQILKHEISSNDTGKVWADIAMSGWFDMNFNPSVNLQVKCIFTFLVK